MTFCFFSQEKIEKEEWTARILTPIFIDILNHGYDTVFISPTSQIEQLATEIFIILKKIYHNLKIVNFFTNSNQIKNYNTNTTNSIFPNNSPLNNREWIYKQMIDLSNYAFCYTSEHSPMTTKVCLEYLKIKNKPFYHLHNLRLK